MPAWPHDLRRDARTPNPWLSAKNSDLETFLAEYDPVETPRFEGSAGTTALLGAMGNKDPETRDADMGPLHDALFSRPDLDLDAPASRTTTVRQLLAQGNPDYKPRASDAGSSNTRLRTR